MKLLGSDTSPYTRKARLVLLEKGLPHAYVVAPPREPGSPVPQHNPLGRVPTLLLDDGTAVFDSPVICEYLDTLNDRPILIPRSDPLERMRVRRWEALADGIMDSAVVVRLESLRPAEKQDPPTLALHGNAISRALALAERWLGGRSWWRNWRDDGDVGGRHRGVGGRGHGRDRVLGGLGRGDFRRL